MIGNKGWVMSGMATMVAIGAAGVGEAQTIGQMAAAGAGDLAQIPRLIEMALYLCGVVLVGAGIVKFKRYNEASRDQGLGGAIATLAVGAALLALPAVYQGISQTFGVDDSATIQRPTLE